MARTVGEVDRVRRDGVRCRGATGVAGVIPTAGCRRFPIQGSWTSRRRPGWKPSGTVPWSVAEIAYAAYAARYGRGQSIETMAERGGFGHEEMDLYAPGWSDSFEAAP